MNEHFPCGIKNKYIITFREAIHVGNAEFPNSGDVYFSMINDFMQSSIHDIEFLLEHYKVNNEANLVWHYSPFHNSLHQWQLQS